MSSSGTPGGPPGPVAALLMLLVRAYRLLPRSAFGRCRFFPSCSAYALEALEVHGGWRGSWLIVRRLGRCHPFHPGGVNPVPEARDGQRPQPSGQRQGARA